MTTNDHNILRDLARRYLDICHTDEQVRRRDLWRAHNSLKETPIPIYVRAFAWHEMRESACQCRDPFFHSCESFFRESLFMNTFDDDYVFEPWLTVRAFHVVPFPEEWGGPWGLPVKWEGGDNPRVAKRWDPPLKDPEDFKKLFSPEHKIDEKKSQEIFQKVCDAIGNVIPVYLDRSPLYTMWNGDISTQLCQMRGIEQLMLDMMDRPAWLHELLSFMRDGILRTHKQAEEAGDWTLANHQNQAIPYAEEMKDPSLSGAAAMDQLWYFAAAQELTLVGPAMFDEFMLQYQLPIMSQFGLVAYGCCEDLTRKIELLRKIPNLRRIAVSPFADVRKCAEKIAGDYVISYRPSPADMVGYDFDPDRIKKILTRDLLACKGCCVDITLKDVETVQGDPNRIRNWVQLVRGLIAEL